MTKVSKRRRNNIIISDSKLRTILPPQFKKMSARYKVMFWYECCISDKIINSSLITWRSCSLKQLKYQSHNAQNRRYDEIESRILEACANSGRPHDFYIHNTAEDTSMGKCVPVLMHIMRCFNGNVFYVVVINAQLLSYKVKRQIEIQQIRVQQ